MKCRHDFCERMAVTLFCEEHRPDGLPVDLERPPAGPDEDTADLRPVMEPIEDLSGQVRPARPARAQ